MLRAFTQVDVFGGESAGFGRLTGNPVAVVHDATGLADAQLAGFAAWTNLSETTYVLPPTTPEADYRVRIFTPRTEIAFAGHPTLGTAHAWLQAGGVPACKGIVVQECGVGLVRVRCGERLAFAAPPLIRSGPLDSATYARVLRALRLSADQILDAAWVDNGAGFLGVQLADAASVLGLEPDFAAFGDLEIGVLGPHPIEDRTRLGADVEVRAFVPSFSIPEDPVTGSLNAGLAQWLIGSGVLPPSYVAAQGTALGRAGRVHVEQDGADIWVGGATRTVISGAVAI